MDLKQIKLLQI